MRPLRNGYQNSGTMNDQCNTGYQDNAHFDSAPTGFNGPRGGYDGHGFNEQAAPLPNNGQGRGAPVAPSFPPLWDVPSQSAASVPPGSTLSFNVQSGNNGIQLGEILESVFKLGFSQGEKSATSSSSSSRDRRRSRSRDRRDRSRERRPRSRERHTRARQGDHGSWRRDSWRDRRSDKTQWNVKRNNNNKRQRETSVKPRPPTKTQKNNDSATRADSTSTKEPKKLTSKPPLKKVVKTPLSQHSDEDEAVESDEESDNGGGHDGDDSNDGDDSDDSDDNYQPAPVKTNIPTPQIAAPLSNLLYGDIDEKLPSEQNNSVINEINKDLHEDDIVQLPPVTTPSPVATPLRTVRNPKARPRRKRKNMAPKKSSGPQ